jgi:D-sedoheptulose 7-phosphate isomerase
MTHKQSHMHAFVRDYFTDLKVVVDRIDIAQVVTFLGELERAYNEDRQIFIIGNGGSAGTASHMACDLASLAKNRIVKSVIFVLCQ